jgi:hypothetical protein
MKIITNNEKVKQVIENQFYQINYGNLQRGDDTRVDFIFEDAKFRSFEKSCQCTAPTLEPINENSFKVTIHYDSNKQGTINQFAKVHLETENSSLEMVKIDLIGHVM